MTLIYFLIFLVLVWLITATIWDLKKREVPDWLNFSLIAIALFVRLLFSLLEKDLSFFFWGLIYFAIFFILANLFYYTKIFAGGDAKLLIGIGVILAEPPKLASFSSIFPLPFTFVANLLLIGSVYGILFMVFYAFKNKDSFVKEFQKKKKEIKLTPYLILAFILIAMFLITKNWFFFIIAILALLLPYLYFAAKVTEKVGLIVRVQAKYLTEGDWLVKPIKIGKRIIKPTWEGLSKKEIILLSKTNNKILIRYGIPFVPAFLLALIISLFIGNIFEIIMALF